MEIICITSILSKSRKGKKSLTSDDGNGWADGYAEIRRVTFVAEQTPFFVLEKKEKKNKSDT